MGKKEDYKNVCWGKEFEEFTSIYPESTGLEVKLMLDDCNAAKQSNHPVVVFMQNSYDPEIFDAKIPISADADAKNIFNMPVNIRHRDYVDVRLWIMQHWKLIQRLSRMEIDIFGFEDLIMNITCGDTKMTDKEIKEEILTLEQIRQGITRKHRDAHVIIWKIFINIEGIYGYSIAIGKNESGKVINAVVKTSTHENVFGDTVFSAVMPMVRRDNQGIYVLVYPDDDSIDAVKMYISEDK